MGQVTGFQIDMVIFFLGGIWTFLLMIYWQGRK